MVLEESDVGPALAGLLTGVRGLEEQSKHAALIAARLGLAAFFSFQAVFCLSAGLYKLCGFRPQRVS